MTNKRLSFLRFALIVICFGAKIVLQLPDAQWVDSDVTLPCYSFWDFIINSYYRSYSLENTTMNTTGMSTYAMNVCKSERISTAKCSHLYSFLHFVENVDPSIQNFCGGMLNHNISSFFTQEAQSLRINFASFHSTCAEFFPGARRKPEQKPKTLMIPPET